MPLRYTEKGTGEALVLIHGHPFDRTMWQPQIDHFSATRRVIAPDLRGYGESRAEDDKTAGKTAGKTLLETFAHDIADLLDHLEADRCTLGGLSMGGQIAMEFGRHHADRLNALLFADTTARGATPEEKQDRTEMAEKLLRDGMRGYADDTLRKMVAPGDPAVDEHVHRMMRETSPKAAAAALRGRAERPDYLGTLREIAVPTLVVVGSEDTFTPVEEAELIHETVPHSTLVVIEGAAHMPNLERPAQFNAALADLLRSPRSA